MEDIYDYCAGQKYNRKEEIIMPAGSIYWIEKGMMGDRLINEACTHLDQTEEFAYFEIHSYFIHSVHPLGFFREMGVTVDGKKMNVDDLFFVVRGNWVPARYMPTISDIWWYQSETARIYIRHPGGFSPGPHTVELSMTLQSLFNTKTLDVKNISVPMRMSLKKEMFTEGGV